MSAGRRSGMGLALASAVTAAHRGRLVLAQTRDGGAHSRLELPMDFTRTLAT
jgi:K+-sensing histidine kinase KdpD